MAWSKASTLDMLGRVTDSPSFPSAHGANNKTFLEESCQKMSKHIHVKCLVCLIPLAAVTTVELRRFYVRSLY